MSLWNPNAFSITGQPLAPAAPPALRVQGGLATPQQLAMAQQAFAAFCAHSRLSAAPNPTQIGRLQDGSPYRIVVVGNTATMELQVEGPGELARRSGIGLSLTTLNGGLVPGHIHKDGLRPQPYILTPEVQKGTRKCTGKWRVRKVDGYSGGKAVWGDKAGMRFFAGVGGLIYDLDLMDHQSIEMIFGTNNRAYWSGEYAPGTHFYANGEKTVGSFRDRVDTVPFLRRRSNGEIWVMQITPVHFPDPKLQLHGEKYSAAESVATVGVLLDEMSIPHGYSMLWQSITVSPDGKSARMMMRKTADFLYAKVDLAITDDALVLSSMTSSGSQTFGESTTTTTGSQQGNGTFTRTTITTPGWSVLPGGYGYDAKGGKTEFRLRQATFGSIEGHSHTVEQRSGTEGVFVDGYRYSDLTINANVVQTFHDRSFDYGERAVSFDAGNSTTTSNSRELDEAWTDIDVPGGERRRVARTGNSQTDREDSITTILFVDPLTDLYITSHHTHQALVTTVTDYTYVFPPGHPGGVTDNSTLTETHSYARRLLVRCRGAEVLRVETPISGPEHYARMRYVASSATDPLTGAVCVNVLELDALAGADAPALRSWIILADDRGAKMLHEVMDVPAGTDIRIEKDYALLSVV